MNFIYSNGEIGWPGMADEGILGGSVIFLQKALENRQNEKLHRVYAELLGTEELLINHDRYGLFRPTKGEKYQKKWATTPNCHLDCSPWDYFTKEESTAEKEMLSNLSYKFALHFITENNEIGVQKDNELHIQGLFNLADNRAQDGGFVLVPRFHSIFSNFFSQ